MRRYERASLIRLVGLLACASPVGAQVFVEGGGGWNHVPPHPATTGSVFRPHGFNLRAAVGRVITPRVRVRVEAFTIQFNDKIPVYTYLPCVSYCAPVDHEARYEGNASGVAATGLVNVDSRGVFYVVGGAGLFFNADAISRFDASLMSELRLGVVAGAGLTVPIGGRLRGFAEARWNGPFGNRAVAPWIVPVIVGLRY
ncbi:MAG: hypothetical protein ACYC5V_07280 [Gemmatimonadaceae bacterium]